MRVIASLSGRASPEAGQIAVYWPLANVTNIYYRSQFNADFIRPEGFGGDVDFPETTDGGCDAD